MRKLRQTLVLQLALFVSVAWLGAGLAAQQAAASGATDAAYAQGYNTGYPLGEQDQRQGASPNAHKFREYQDGRIGYTPDYGTPEAYRSSFQSGFDDGYGDGFGGRPRSVAAPAPPATAPDAQPPAMDAGSPLSDAVKTARSNGYREGYRQGQTDAGANAAFNATAGDVYQQANAGYTRDLGEPDQYQLNFRSGYTLGYGDGYNHRLYNTAMGGHSLPVVPASGGANDLPTDPERLRARPSGVYDNGLLLAEGTRLQTTLNRSISTKTARVGDPFTLTITVPVWVGAIAAIPAGSTIQGTIAQVQRGGTFSGSAQLQLQYNTLVLPGQPPIPLNATTAGVGAAAQKVDQNEGTVNGQAPDTGKRAATGAAVGGVLGGIFGGTGGLIRGGIAGAAVGAGGAMISHKKDLELRDGEPVLVRLERPLELPKDGTPN
ncbi:MAG TPA: hypothetical protein VN515_00680 [Terriglobales bacterium]|nr:hypothetical protein [Terriglobales bacterium]